MRWSTIWAVPTPFTSPPHSMVITKRLPVGPLKLVGAGLGTRIRADVVVAAAS